MVKGYTLFSLVSLSTEAYFALYSDIPHKLLIMAHNNQCASVIAQCQRQIMFNLTNILAIILHMP